MIMCLEHRLWAPCGACLGARVNAPTLHHVHPSPRDLIEQHKLADANESLRRTLRQALSRLRDLERASGVCWPELGELESALGEIPQ